MTKAKKADYQTKTLEELSTDLVTKKTELSNAQLALLSGELANTRQIDNLKREIARILTAVNQMEIEEMEEK